MRKTSIAFAAFLLFGVSCTQPTQKLDSALRSLPEERWETAQKGRIDTYPPLARLAGISGDLVFTLQINDQGQVTNIKLVSGPPQLAVTVENLARGIRFRPTAEDLPGPWQFSITARFDLSGKAGWAPTGEKIILEPVSTPSPSY